jgi:demethylmenaquinone methyltransferase / 2-methoxy-6-polyprenyl-1,4-benzoquinol methylase
LPFPRDRPAAPNNTPPLADAFSTPEHKRRFVRRLFATIADRYDLITILLSYGRDRHWKARLIASARPRPGEHVLDLATGTGDLALLAARDGAHVVGLDVTPRMVQLAAAKTSGASPRFLVGDMMALPFRDQSFDVITTGYGLRNVPDLAGAISEARRVLRPDGRFYSLDFNRPRARVVRSVYLFYLSTIGGVLGWVLHRDADTYRYIPASIRNYPGADGVADLMRRAGFRRVTHRRVLAGLMAIHEAQK